MNNNNVISMSQKIESVLEEVCNDMATTSSSREEYINKLTSFLDGKTNEYDYILRIGNFKNNESLRDMMRVVISMRSYICSVYELQNRQYISQSDKNIYDNVELSKNFDELVDRIKKSDSLKNDISKSLHFSTLEASKTQLAKEYNALLFNNKVKKVITMIPDMMIKYMAASLDTFPQDMITSEILDIYVDKLFNADETLTCNSTKAVKDTWKLMQKEYINDPKGINKIGYLIGNVYSNLKLNEKYLGKVDKSIIKWLETEGVDLKTAYVFFMINENFGCRVLDNFAVFNSMINPEYRKQTENNLKEQGFIKIMKKYDTYYKENK